jgi:hypothetical protein
MNTRNRSEIAVLMLVSALFWVGLAWIIEPSGVALAQEGGPATGLCLNEVLASNTKSGLDPQGQYEDWIELYNTGTQSIDCGGMYLTDDLDNPTKWRIPSGDRLLTTVPAQGFLVIWADGDTGASGLHAGFGLSANGDEVALFDRDGITQIDYVRFDQQEADISFGRLPDGTGEWQRLGLPTPGAQNDALYEGFVAEPTFSPERGFYDGEIQVTLSTSTEGATIYYTTDSSEPYVTGGRVPTGRIYQSPIRLVQTTCVRAKAVKPGWRPSTIVTHTYIFLRDVVRQSAGGTAPAGWPSGSVNGQTLDYGMDPDVTNDPRYKDLIDDALRAIPSISLVSPLDNFFGQQNGFYVHASSEGRSWERPVSVELINPDGSPGFWVNAGIRVRGGYSRSGSNPKHAFRLFFRPEYGQSKLKFPLFGDEGTDEFENLDLRCSQNYSWSFGGDRQNTAVREVFSRDLQGEMGHPYTRSRYYHVYLDGQYWGLYQSEERPEAAFAASYCGGDKEDYDVVKSESGPYSMTNTDGNMDAYRRLYDAATAGLAGVDTYYRLQGLNIDGTPNPAYERMVDVDDLIDFMIIDYYTGDRDGPGSRFVNRPNNTYGFYNRVQPAGWQWVQHDNEHTLGVSQSETNLVTPFTSAGRQWPYFNPHWLHEQFANNNLEYRLRFADRVYRFFFNGGLLTPDVSIAGIQRRATQIETAIIAESARWGDARRSTPFTQQDWRSEIDRIVNDYLPGRTQVVLSQFKSVGWYPNIDPPVFNQRGGHVVSDFLLQMSPASPTVYYTVDGCDPRQPGGAVNTQSARQYGQPVRLAMSRHVKARALSNNTWSALNEAVFTVGPVAESLRISEIMYHPLDSGNPDDPNTEYIELSNTGGSTINLNLVRFAKGVDFTFPGFELPAGGYCVLVKDLAAFEARYGSQLPVAGQYAGSLNNNGERLELVDAGGATIESFVYDDEWFAQTDGGGQSLTRADPQADGNEPAAWRPAPPSPGSAGL